MADHQLSKLTNGMIKPPINPGTGAYSTLHDEDRIQHQSSLQDHYNEDVLAVDQPEPKNFKPMSDLERNPGLDPFEMDRDKLTTEFYHKLQELKNEHQKTLKMLELLYSEAESRCHQAKNFPTETVTDRNFKVTQNGMSVERNQREGVFLTDKDSVSTQEEYNIPRNTETSDEDLEESSDEDIGVKNEIQEKRAIQFQEPERLNVSHSGRNDRIKEMWDDFNLRDYLPPSVVERAEREKKKKMRPKSAPPKKEWSPIITIPKPFNMTLREEQKKEKSHTRSSEAVAREARERLEQEELELQMRVRAKDPPAHTYLPLYEEIMERQEQRSRMNRVNASRALQAMVKPFSFAEREKMKEIEKNEKINMEAKKEKKKLKSMVEFVAKPIPSSVYDATVMERMKEEQLYRKIKVKLRSEDLMRSSSLPPRMHSHEMMYAKRREQRNRDIRKANKLSFRPETHDMPDFEALHRRDQLEQSARKMELETTMTEPFQLRTAAIRQKKQALQEANEKMQKEEENYRKSLGVGKAKKYSYSSDTIPTRMTESARLRLEETKRALAKAEEELIELKLKDRARKERRRKMTEEIAARTLMSSKDLTQPNEYRREKLKQYQRQQKARNAEYQQELRDMNDRLKQRPLLFEQQAQSSARQKAEKRYKEILRNSGLSDDKFDENTGLRKSTASNDISSDGYSDDEFETSIVKSGQTPSKSDPVYNEDSDSDISEEIEDDRDTTTIKKHLEFDD